MTWPQLVFEILRLSFWGGCRLTVFMYLLACTVFRFGYFLVTTAKEEEEEEQTVLPMLETYDFVLQLLCLEFSCFKYFLQINHMVLRFTYFFFGSL